MTIKELKEIIGSRMQECDAGRSSDDQRRYYDYKWFWEQLNQLEEGPMEQAVAVKQEFTPMVLTVEDVKRYIAPKATDKELFMFMGISKAYGLNPMKREIHFIKYGENKAQIVVGYETYLKRAEKTGKLDGWKCWIETDTKGEKAIIEIKRKDWGQPFRWEVYRTEVDKKQSTWTQMPSFMLKKVCIAQGFRLAFPEDLGGMPYIPEEISSDKSEDLPTENHVEPEKQTEIEKPKKPATSFIDVMARERTRLGDATFIKLLGANGYEQLDEITDRKKQEAFYRIVCGYPTPGAKEPGDES